MGLSVNKKGGLAFNGDYQKLILIRLGQFANLAKKNYKDLSAADQHEIHNAFDKLDEKVVLAEWAKITKKK